jgi:hypothetical protein
MVFSSSTKGPIDVNLHLFVRKGVEDRVVPSNLFTKFDDVAIVHVERVRTLRGRAVGCDV